MLNERKERKIPSIAPRDVLWPITCCETTKEKEAMTYAREVTEAREVTNCPQRNVPQQH